MKESTTKRLWLDLVAKNPKAFGIEAGFEDLTEIHNQWIRWFILRSKDITLQAHRGSFKTTCLSIAIALLIVLHPEKSIIFMRKTDDDVKEVVVQVKKLLLTPMYNSLAKALYNLGIKLTKETAFEVETNLKQGPRGAAQLLGIGCGGSITGKHADIVITDDIVNIKDRYSKAEREKTKIIYQELENVKNRGGRYINCGTPWHKDDAFILMPNLKKYDAYSTGLISREELQHLKERLSPSLFSANYELKHVADENLIFTNPKIFEGNSMNAILNGICHIDASYGGADSSAFTILKPQPDGALLVFGKLWQKHIDDCLPEIESLRARKRAGTLYNETNADKGYLIQKISKPVMPYHENLNKTIKILTHLKANWHRVYFTEDTDTEYIEQITEYHELAERDDAPDSLASLIRAVDKRKSPDVSDQIATIKRLGL